MPVPAPVTRDAASGRAIHSSGALLSQPVERPFSERDERRRGRSPPSQVVLRATDVVVRARERQARLEGMTLVSRDPTLKDYGISIA
jgi:hypothetical protein